MRVFLGIDFVETLLEHFCFLEVGFLSGVLAAGEEDVWVRGRYLRGFRVRRWRR